MKCKFCGAEVQIGKFCDYCGSMAEPSYYDIKPEQKKESTQKEEHSNVEIEMGKVFYTVLPGDTLWNISKIFYGTGACWLAIFDANRKEIKNPKLLYPGQRLKIPRFKGKVGDLITPEMFEF